MTQSKLPERILCKRVSCLAPRLLRAWPKATLRRPIQAAQTRSKTKFQPRAFVNFIQVSQKRSKTKFQPRALRKSSAPKSDRKRNSSQELLVKLHVLCALPIEAKDLAYKNDVKKNAAAVIREACSIRRSMFYMLLGHVKLFIIGLCRNYVRR